MTHLSESAQRAAIETCARSLGVKASDLYLYGGDAKTTHFRSELLFIGVHGDKANPQYVIKFGFGTEWSSEREFEELKVIASLLGASGSSAKFKVITPVWFGTDPPALVTHFQPGRSLEPTISAAIRKGARTAIGTAVNDVEAIAGWIEAIQCDSRYRDPEQYIDEWKASVEKCGEELGRLDVGLRRCVNRIRSYTRQLGTSDRDSIARAVAHRGDCRPANFLKHEGVLVGVDLEAFGYDGVEVDRAVMRRYLAFEAVGRKRRAERAGELWQRFIACTEQSGPVPRLVLLAYVQLLLRELCEQLACPRTWNLKYGIRRWSWIRSRRAWLQQLEGGIDRDALLCYSIL